MTSKQIALSKLSKVKPDLFFRIVIAACVLLVFFMLERQADLGAFLKVALISGVLLFLPGYFLSHLMGLPRLSLAARLTLSFSVSIGLWSIPAVLLIWLHSNLNVMLGVVITTILIAGAGLLARYARRRSQRQAKQDSSASSASQLYRIDIDWIRLLYLVSLVGAITLVMITFIDSVSLIRGDRLTYQAFVRHFVDSDQFFDKGFRISPEFVIRNARELIQPWLIIVALIVELSDVALLDVYGYYLPVFLIPLSFLALYELAKELFESEIVAITACLVQTLYYFSDIPARQEGIGYSLLFRVVEDKFMIRFVLLPIALWLTLHYLKHRRKGTLMAVSIAIIAVGLVHPIGIVLYGISIGVFLLVNLSLTPWPEITGKLVAYSPLIGVALIVFLVPFWQIRQTSTVEIETPRHQPDPIITFDLEAGLKSSSLGPLRTERLFVISKEDGQFISSPNLIAHPLMILAILLTPLLIKYLPRDVGAQFIFANMTGVLFLCYTPFVTPTLGKMITPWMIWRVLWLLPVALVIAFFLERGVRQLRQRLKGTSPWLRAVPLGIIILTVPFLGGTIGQGLLDLNEIENLALSHEERDLLSYLRRYGQAESYILTPELQLDDEIPGLVGHSYGLTFRNSPPRFESAPEDQELFYNISFPTRLHLDILQKYDIRYVVTKTRTELARQLSLFPGMFEILYANNHYILYQGDLDKATETEKETVEANTFFLESNYPAAEISYRQALRRNPTFVPALIGLGDLYLQQGNSIGAIKFYQQASDINPQDPYLQLSLAEAYLAQGQTTDSPPSYRQAAAAYRRALRLAPDDLKIREAILTAYLLGDSYHLQDLKAEIVAAYQKAIELEPEEIQTYRRLGQVYEILGEPEKATAVYAGVIDRWPALAEGHLWLGQAYEARADIGPAIAAYEQAIGLEPTQSTAYTRLGNLYQSHGQPDEVISLYKTAARDNPDRAWPHLELGKVYLDRARSE